MDSPREIHGKTPFQLAALLAAPCVFVALILVFGLRPWLDEEADESFVRRGRSLAVVFAHAIEPGVVFEDPDHVTETLARLGASGEVTYVNVRLRGGHPFASWSGGASGTAATSRPMATSIVVQGLPVGVVELGVPLRFLRDQQRSNAFICYGAAGLVAFFGVVCGILGARFVARRRREEAERKQLQERLLLADRLASVGTLAAGIAHEINNPLTYVLGNLSFAKSELQRALAGQEHDLPELIAVLDEAQQGGEQVRAIVRDLKTFSRDDHETVGSVDVHKVLESALNMATNEVKHRARVIREYGATSDIAANESRLGQVFLNLVVNAAQAIPAGELDRHTICLRTRQGGDGSVIVEVQDSGAGIPEAILGRIFDPFFTTKPVGVGTGLGLSICHAIVRSMGGEIHVESRVGQGTTFRLRLPAAADEAAPPPPKPEPISAPITGGRILIVDDESSVGIALSRMLGGHDVEVETDARAALERVLASPGRYDVILCDLMMPVLSGMELYEAISACAPDILDRIVFITGGAFTASARDFLQRVPNERLEKPLAESQLGRAIASQLESCTRRVHPPCRGVHEGDGARIERTSPTSRKPASSRPYHPI